MNKLYRILIYMWLAVCSLFIWFGCAALGFVLCFSDLYFMYNVSPLIGLTGVICIILFGMRVSKWMPADYVHNKLEKLFVKAKI